MFRRLNALLVLALVISGLAINVAPVAAEVAPATLQLTIKEVRALECFEGLTCGEADFYSVVRFGDDPKEHVSPVIDDNNHPFPNWQFEVPVDHNARVVGGFPIYIEIWDEDGGFRLGDDRADISPITGKSNLELRVDWGRLPCAVSGDVSGTCGIEIVASGNGDGDGNAEIIFQVRVIPTMTDSDGDGIPDVWERNGVTLNGQFIDLPAMGADPNKPDIFLHIDWMQDATHDQRLSNAAIRRVVDAFANSPYRSPTGSRGINLHVDQGRNSILNFNTNATWGDLSRAQRITWKNNIGSVTADGRYDWTEFQTFKSTNFEPTGRSPIFHYAIAAYFLEPPPPGKAQNTSGGISRGIEASDFLITLGGSGGAGSTLQQAGTLMHELGHNLGLRHGGDEDRNFKPNYLSVMNYLFGMRGVDVGTTAGVIDYAGGQLPVLGPIDENELDESRALGVSGFGTGSMCRAADGSVTGQYTVDANGPYDWNCNGVIDLFYIPLLNEWHSIVSYDANGDGVISSNLHSYDDWANIKLRVGGIGSLGDAAMLTLTPLEPEHPWDYTPPTTTVSVAPAPTSYGWNKSSVTVTLTASDNPGGFGVRDITYSASGAQTIATKTVLGSSASFVVSNEGVTTVTYTARDHALNSEATKTLTVRVDRTMPTITLGTAYPAPNAAGWNNTDVNVPFTATDGPSGIAYTVPSASPLVLTAEGTAVTGTVTAYDKADNSASVTSPAFKIDKTPPVITVTAPAPNQVFDSDQTMTPIFDATDALSGVKSVVGVLDTGQVVTSGEAIDLGLLVGKRTLTVTATDVADNVATTVIPFRVRPVFVGDAFDDPNQSAMREAGEAGLPGVTVFLDTDGNGKLDPGEATNVTGANGAYRVVGEDVGPARVCTLPVSSDRVRTTARCQTVMVATGIPVPRTDFGSHTRVPGAKNGSVANVIQSIALAGQPDQYWRPAALQGTASGPWAGSRLVVKNGGSNPQVQVQTGERVAIGLFVGGVDATKVDNLVLDIQVQSSIRQQLVAITAADGQVATGTSGPTTSFAYSISGNIVTIYGVPQDGLGGYQDVWVVIEVTDSNGNLSPNARIAGTVVSQKGALKVQSLGNTSNDNSMIGITNRLGGTRPGALLVDDIPGMGTTTNPF